MTIRSICSVIIWSSIIYLWIIFLLIIFSIIFTQINNNLCKYKARRIWELENISARNLSMMPVSIPFLTISSMTINLSLSLLTISLLSNRLSAVWWRKRPWTAAGKKGTLSWLLSGWFTMSSRKRRNSRDASIWLVWFSMDSKWFLSFQRYRWRSRSTIRAKRNKKSLSLCRSSTRACITTGSKLSNKHFLTSKPTYFTSAFFQRSHQLQSWTAIKK